ncbi:N-acetylglucosamine kinase [Brachybacterium sp. DNPG3]
MGPAATIPAEPLVLAAIMGTTRSRIQLARRDGDPTPVLDAHGPGAPAGSHGLRSLETLLAAARSAVLDAGARPEAPVRIAAVSLDVHGLARTELEDALEIARRELACFGPHGEVVVDLEHVHVGDDLLPAFLAGGVGDSGILLRAGSGTVAVRFEERRPRERRDGMGWLLGDIGSAVWIGRRTIQAVAADLDGRGRRTRLTESVGDLLGLDLRDGVLPPSPTGEVRDDLVRAIAALDPGRDPSVLGRFAPLPGEVPEDPAARAILDKVMRHFADTVRSMDPQCGLPVVLAGSVLATPGPIHDELITGLDADGREHREVLTGLPGAVRLARERAASAG